MHILSAEELGCLPVQFVLQHGLSVLVALQSPTEVPSLSLEAIVTHHTQLEP